MIASATMTSGGTGAPPTELMKACRSGLDMNAWNCSTLAHSSITRMNPSPTPNLWWSPPTALESSEIFANSSARSFMDCRNLAVSPWNFAMTSTLMSNPSHARHALVARGLAGNITGRPDHWLSP